VTDEREPELAEAAAPISRPRPRYRLALTLLVGPPVLQAVFRFDELIASILAIIWIFVSVPIGILVTLDWFRYAAHSTRVARLFRHILRGPIFLLGAVAVVIGVSVLAWAAYNLLWERQPEFRWSGLRAIWTMVSLIGFGAYLVRLAVQRSADSKTERQMPRDVRR
jgi:hypothetical protein